MKFLIRSAVLASACALGFTTFPAPAAEQLTLLADVASSALKPFDQQIFRDFEKRHPGVKIEAKSLSGGAVQKDIDEATNPVDIGIVGKKQTDYLDKQGRINKPVAILTQKEAILVPWNGAKVKSLKDLANPGIKVGLADAGSAVGAPARALLKKAAEDPAYGADFPQRVVANVQCKGSKGTDMPDSIRSGACDAAIGFVSDEDTLHIRTVTIPDALNVETPYYAFVPKVSKNQKIADELVKYIASKQGLSILHSYHYLPPPKS